MSSTTQGAWPGAFPVHPDTHSGITNAKLGMWLFLASEVMLFATLFTTYIVLRTAAPDWPESWNVLNVPLAMLNTFILISSSVTMVLAYAKCWDKDVAGTRKYLLLTLLLACGFLVVKTFEYGAKFSHHHYPSSSIFYAIYFTLTGLHCLHVIGGIGVIGWFYAKTWDKAYFEHPLYLGRIEGTGLYWHFVDLVWIFLFPALYLL
jgi:heme/copper-type cytochrome/quinol oxidase subunit 3